MGEAQASDHCTVPNCFNRAPFVSTISVVSTLGIASGPLIVKAEPESAQAVWCVPGLPGCLKVMIGKGGELFNQSPDPARRRRRAAKAVDK